MKIWCGYGSEHSMNLVMIGQFREERDAAAAKSILDRLSEQVNADVESHQMQIGKASDRFTDGMLDLLRDLNVNLLGPAELEQFGYDVDVEIRGNQVVVTTDEADVSVFLKVLIDKGGRVEVFSAHNYPDTGFGRGR
ncbi:MAG: DUF6375 family protein [Symbiobacteriia bacterium]